MAFLFRMVLLFLFGAAVFPLNSFHCAAQTFSPGEFGCVQNKLFYKDVSMVNTPVPVLFSKPPEDDGPRYPGIIVGGILLFGGGMLYYIGHTMALKNYDDYRESAFTAQTDQLRRKITVFNGMRVGGGVVGGLGAIILVTSF